MIAYINRLAPALSDQTHMNKSTSVVMVMPGTEWQLPLIKNIKEQGHYILLLNPTIDPIICKYVDYIAKVDIMNEKQCIKIAKEYEINAVLHDQSDIAVRCAAKIAEELNLSGITYKQALICTDKWEMRRFAQKIGVSIPKFRLFQSFEESYCFVQTLDSSVIIKPIDSNCSRGVYIVNKNSFSKDQFDRTAMWSKDKKSILIEEYVDGPEFTVDGIVQNNKHKSLAISEKTAFSENPTVAKQLTFSNYHERYSYDDLRAINDYLYNKLELEEGCITHAEYKYNHGSFVLIEFAARGGGNLIASHIVPYMSGVRNYDYHISCRLNAASPEPNISSENYDWLAKEKYAMLLFFECENNSDLKMSRIIQEIRGKEFLEKEKNIISHGINYSIGDLLPGNLDDSKRLGYSLVIAESMPKLLKLKELIRESVQFITDDD